MEQANSFTGLNMDKTVLKWIVCPSYTSWGFTSPYTNYQVSWPLSICPTNISKTCIPEKMIDITVFCRGQEGNFRYSSYLPNLGASRRNRFSSFILFQECIQVSHRWCAVSGCRQHRKGEEGHWNTGWALQRALTSPLLSLEWKSCTLPVRWQHPRPTVFLGPQPFPFYFGGARNARRAGWNHQATLHLGEVHLGAAHGIRG